MSPRRAKPQSLKIRFDRKRIITIIITITIIVSNETTPWNIFNYARGIHPRGMDPAWRVRRNDSSPGWITNASIKGGKLSPAKISFPLGDFTFSNESRYRSLLLKRGRGKKRMEKWGQLFRPASSSPPSFPRSSIKHLPWGIGRGISYTLFLFPANKLRFRSVHHPSNIVTTRTTYFSPLLPPISRAIPLIRSSYRLLWDCTSSSCIMELYLRV